MIKIAIIVFAILLTLLTIIFYLIWRYDGSCSPVNVHMAFNKWYKLYKLNPDRYKIETYSIETLDRIYYQNPSSSYGASIYRIIFNYFGYLAFLVIKFKISFDNKKKKKYNRNIESNKGLELICKTAQQDIEDIRKQSNKEISEAKRIIEHINFK